MKYFSFKSNRGQLFYFFLSRYYCFVRKIICLTITLSFLAVNAESKNCYPSNIDFIRNISGIVKEAHGNPLHGVSEVVKGTQKGTSTDLDGSFSIDANIGDSLVFSMVGFHRKSMIVGQNENIIVIMELEAVLGEEVVVAATNTVTLR